MIRNFFRKTPIIEFYCTPEFEGVLPEPQVAGKYMPDWFKALKLDTGDKDSRGFNTPSAKRCLPMLDAMTFGYVLRTAADIHVITNHDCSIIKAETKEECPFPAVERHGWQQVRSEKWDKNVPRQDPLKFINHWIIKTAPGYSCLIQTLPNHMTKDFMCLSAVVDTDKYPKEINFPAIWLTPNFDGKIPAGTPLVQVIPFKRDKLPKPIIRSMTQKEIDWHTKTSKQQSSREHVYTRELREVK